LVAQSRRGTRAMRWGHPSQAGGTDRFEVDRGGRRRHKREVMPVRLRRVGSLANEVQSGRDRTDSEEAGTQCAHTFLPDPEMEDEGVPGQNWHFPYRRPGDRGR
jgi:hypothetical protein